MIPWNHTISTITSTGSKASLANTRRQHFQNNTTQPLKMQEVFFFLQEITKCSPQQIRGTSIKFYKKINVCVGAIPPQFHCPTPVFRCASNLTYLESFLFLWTYMWTCAWWTPTVFQTVLKYTMDVSQTQIVCRTKSLTWYSPLEGQVKVI